MLPGITWSDDGPMSTSTEQPESFQIPIEAAEFYESAYGVST
jgi:hypothetical protein